jgi:hypothetical protein
MFRQIERNSGIPLSRHARRPYFSTHVPSHRNRLASPSHHQGAALTLLAHDAPLTRDRHLSHARVWSPRRSPPALRSLLIPSIWLRSRLRLALERRDDDRLRRREGRAPLHRSRSRALRRPRQGRHLASHSDTDRADLRAHRQRSRISGLRESLDRKGRQRRRAGWLSTLPSRILLHDRGRLVLHAAVRESVSAPRTLWLCSGQTRDEQRLPLPNHHRVLVMRCQRPVICP